ncbi:MAG TPA: OmpA family protein [Polyangiaceae bacterium]|nr:OmpA family protein [Polyangiaceae bacterium]
MRTPISSSLLVAGLGLLLASCGSADTEVKTAAPTAQPPPPPPATAAPPLQVASEDAVLEGDRIKIAKAIHYDVDKDEVRPESFPVLNAVASILKTHPEIIGLTVEGHTDNQGSLDHNRKLSERRANAVVRYLFAQGVTTPMQAPGYGASAPVCMETTDDCRTRNRRVEFRVKKQ